MAQEQVDFIRAQEKNILMMGGRQCLHGDTLLATPFGPKPIKEVYQVAGSAVYTPKGVALAYPGHRGRANLILVKHQFGQFRCTPWHRLLSSRGWLFAKDCSLKFLPRYSFFPAQSKWLITPSPIDYTAVVNVNQAEYGEFFDISVPGHDCYLLADGTVHHNSGKTHAIVHRTALNMTTKENFDTLYTTIDETPCRDVYNRFISHPAIKRLLDKGLAHKRETPQKIVTFFETGSSALFRVARYPKLLKGPPYDEFIADEIQDTWGWDDFIEVQPALVLARNGTTILAGQPRDPLYWYYDWYLDGLPRNFKDLYSEGIGRGVPDYKTIVFPTSHGVLYQNELGRVRLQKLKEKISAKDDFIWKRDYDCFWMVDEKSKAFPSKDVQALFKAYAPEERPLRGHVYIISIDLGWSHDYGVCIVFDVTGNRVVWAERMPLGMKHEEQRFKFQAIAKRYGATVVIDATGNGNPGAKHEDGYVEMYEEVMPDLRKCYLNWAKNTIITKLKLRIESHAFSIPSVYKEVNAEVAAYEKVCKDGKIEYTSPKQVKDMHDDFVGALGMVFWLIDRGDFGQSTFNPAYLTA